MTTSNVIDVRALINQRGLSFFQKLVIFFGIFIIALDGYDIAAVSYIAPELKRLWHVSNTDLGPVLSAALIGLALGAMLAGPLADKLGRKAVLVVSVFFFGVWTLATAQATDVTHLVLFRFLTGLGLGAAMPNVGTLVSEYAPDRSRSFLVTVVFCGYSLGAAGGGFLSSWMIPHFGWTSVLIVGGVLPIALAPIMLLLMPESVRFLVVKKAASAKIAKIIDKIAPGVANAQSSFVISGEEKVGHGSIRLVLSKQYKFGSLMLWLSYFTGLFLVYLVSSWLPTMIKEAGYSLKVAAVIGAWYQIGGALGSLFCGWAMDRFNPHRVLTLVYLAGGALTYSLGLSAHHEAILPFLSCAVGFCLNGAGTGMNALSASYFPVEARATGSSWMHGFGRCGAILSIFAGAQMLAMGWTFSQVFAALMVPAVITACALIAKNIHGSRMGFAKVETGHRYS